MGQYAIKMPDIGEGIAEVELVEWRVKVGDTVNEDQVLVDVMTDKATVEIPSPVVGKVLALGGEPGKLMAVGAELIRLEVETAGNVKGDALTTSVKATTLTASPAPPTAPALAPVASQPAPARSRASAPAAQVAATPMRTIAHTTHKRQPGEKPLASPAVRRRAWDLGVELTFISGSGPAGRISHEDVDAFVGARNQGNSPTLTLSRQRQGEEIIPVVGLRRKIAQKMQDAKRRIPHFSYVEEIDVTDVEALRVRLNAKYAAERGKLTLLPFIARAMVLALLDFPQLNARFDDDAGSITRHSAVHLGVAAQTDSGLMVPVVRHAEAMDLWQFGTEVSRLAKAARSGKALREELSGSTITISSLGALGGIVTTPVINHPEVAIVGVNRVVERPAFKCGQVVARQLMNLSSSFDHRVVDGMDAAQFIQAVRGLLETPALLFVE